MRAHHVIGVAAVILIGVSAKLFFVSAPTAEANSQPITSVGIDISQLQQNAKELPFQKAGDLSLVYAEVD